MKRFLSILWDKDINGSKTVILLEFQCEIKKNGFCYGMDSKIFDHEKFLSGKSEIIFRTLLGQLMAS